MKINAWLFVAFVSYQADRKVLTQAAVSSSSYKTTRSSAANTNYDKNPAFFSPDGELLQLSYADQAGEQGESLICLVTAEKSIMLVCPALSSSSSQLLDRRCVDKVSRIEDGIWIATAGLLGDTRHLIRQARSFCVDHRKTFGARAKVKTVASYVGTLQHEASLQGLVRPLGVHVITCGFDECFMKTSDGSSSSRDNPVLYLSRASGEVVEWKATAIGKGRAKVLRMLEDNILRPDEDMPGESAAALQARSILERISLRRTLHPEEDVQSSRKEEGDGDEKNVSSSVSSSSSSATTTTTGLDHINDSRSDSGVSSTVTSDEDDDKSNQYDVYILKRSSTDTDTNQQQRYHMERRTIWMI